VSSEFTVIRPGLLSQNLLSSCFLCPANADGKGFVECRSFAGPTLSSPRFSRDQLVDYLRSSERSEPDVVEMKSTPLCSIQSLLVTILHDYWLAKYVMHVMAVDWPRAPDDRTQHGMSTGTWTSPTHDTRWYVYVHSKADEKASLIDRTTPKTE